jgi:hypothetical protein
LRVDLRLGQASEQQVDKRRTDQAQHERGLPPHVAPGRPQQPANDAADARDTPVQQREHRRRNSDEHAASQRGPRREGTPVDGHHFSVGQ